MLVTWSDAAEYSFEPNTPSGTKKELACKVPDDSRTSYPSDASDLVPDASGCDSSTDHDPDSRPALLTEDAALTALEASRGRVVEEYGEFMSGFTTVLDT